jgi:hypothetical protein
VPSSTAVVALLKRELSDSKVLLGLLLKGRIVAASLSSSVSLPRLSALSDLSSSLCKHHAVTIGVSAPRGGGNLLTIFTAASFSNQPMITLLRVGKMTQEN